MTTSARDTAAIIRRFQAARRDPNLVVLEGHHPLKHALRFGAEVEQIVISADASVSSLPPEVTAPPLVIDPTAFDQLTPHPPSDRVIALARRPEVTRVLDQGDVVLLEDPRHLSNLGATVRVAAAAGAAGVMSVGPSDPWHPAAVRGAAGLQFAVAVLRFDTLSEAFAACGSRPIVALDASGTPLSDAAMSGDIAFAFGTERDGISLELRRRCDLILSIPMRPGVSSLNLATAVAVTLYTSR